MIFAKNKVSLRNERGFMDYFLLIGRLWLELCHFPLIIIVSILGYFSKYRSKIIRAILFLLLSFILNANLKCLFKIPLAPHVGKGFAFPSGHMQAACFFWGWLAYELNSKWLTGIIIFLLGGLGYWITFFGYHGYLDIAGAIIVTLLAFKAAHAFNKQIFSTHLSTLALSLILISFPLSLPLLGSLYYSNVIILQAISTGLLLGLFYNPIHYTTTLKLYLKKISFAFSGCLLLGGVLWGISFFMSETLYTFFVCLSITLWVSWGVDYTFKKIKILH